MVVPKGFLGFALAENPNLTILCGEKPGFVRNCINLMGLVHSDFDWKLRSDSLGGKLALTTWFPLSVNNKQIEK